MVYILFFILVIFLLIIYQFTRWDIISPTALTCYGFIIATFVVILNQYSWFPIHANTVLVIITGIFSFGLGEIIILTTYKHKRTLKFSCVKTENQYKELKINKVLLFITMIVSVFVIKGTYGQLLANAYIGGYSGQGHLLNYARRGIIHYEKDSNYLLSIFEYYYTGLAYICSFIISYNTIFLGWKNKYLLYIFPIIPYIIINIAGTGRIWVISFLSYVFVSTILLWYKKYKLSIKSARKTLLTGVGIILLFFLVFNSLGKLTGKTQHDSTFNIISMYTGGSIVGFDQYLQLPQQHVNSIKDTEMFYGIINTLNRLGVDVHEVSRHQSFINIGNNRTNIYTVFKRYYHDLGYSGMLLISFLNGLFLSLLYYYVRRNPKVTFIPIYSLFAGPIISQFLDDLIVTNFLSISQIFTFLFVFIWILIVLKPIKIKTQ